MRTALSAFLVVAIAACGEQKTPEPSPGSGSVSASDPATSITEVPAKDVTTSCENSVIGTAIVAPGAVISPRPQKSVIRLDLVYQGTDVAVRSLYSVDKIIPGGGNGPFSAGVNSGYWVELRDGTGNPLYFHILMDPTIVEIIPPEAGGKFTISTLDVCLAKTILVDVPNNPAAKAIVLFGSPYGTRQPAAEIGRFTLP